MVAAIGPKALLATPGYLRLWLAGGLFMAWVATQNFRQVDRLLAAGNGAATLQLKALGPQGRMIMRY